MSKYLEEATDENLQLLEVHWAIYPPADEVAWEVLDALWAGDLSKEEVMAELELSNSDFDSYVTFIIEFAEVVANGGAV